MTMDGVHGQPVPDLRATDWRTRKTYESRRRLLPLGVILHKNGILLQPDMPQFCLDCDCTLKMTDEVERHSVMPRSVPPQRSSCRPRRWAPRRSFHVTSSFQTTLRQEPEATRRTARLLCAGSEYLR